MGGLGRLGIRFVDIAARLEREGVWKFVEAFDQAMVHITRKCGRVEG
jgi:hypothetical protein